jgi:Fe2+ transport system protein FeoA
MFDRTITLTGASLALMKTGERGKILRFGNMDDRTAVQLKTMGLVPGVALKLEQRSPSFIVRVGNNLLRLNDKMRRSIYVRIT